MEYHVLIIINLSEKIKYNVSQNEYNIAYHTPSYNMQD